MSQRFGTIKLPDPNDNNNYKGLDSVAVYDEVTKDRYTAQDIKAIDNDLNNKVDKVQGKQLSTEDYTTAEKNKLAGIRN